MFVRFFWKSVDSAVPSVTVGLLMEDLETASVVEVCDSGGILLSAAALHRQLGW